MLNDATPSFRELLLNRLTPPDDRDHVRVIVRLKQRETLTVVESAIKVDGLDPGVKYRRRGHRPKNSARTLYCGIAVFETAYRQRVAFVLGVWHRRGTQWFHASLPSDRGRLCRRHRTSRRWRSAQTSTCSGSNSSRSFRRSKQRLVRAVPAELRPKMVEDRVPSG